MCKKTFIFCLLLILLFFPNLYPQQNNRVSSYTPPWLSPPVNLYPNSIFYNPYTIAYAYLLNGLTTQFCRFNVGNPGAITLIGGIQDSVFENGDFANPSGVWKFYVQSTHSPYLIFEVDTSNGTITSVGAPTNFKSGHRPRVISWDHTTNTFYLISSNSTQTETQLYSMYWPTKELTWIGPSATQPALLWAGGFNGNGTFFGIDNNTDALWKVNKFTGAWTQVGPLGHGANYYQAAGFDKSNFSKMLWSEWGESPGSGLFEVDTATGAATLIGRYGGDPVIVAIGFIPYNGPQIIHTPLQNTTNLNGPYVINASIFSTGSGIASTKLFWSRNNATITDSINMTNTSGNNWTGNIPGNGQLATYRYYIWTSDFLNRTATAPYFAPDSLYSFNTVANDTTKPVITHTPLGDITILQWPDTVIATVTDNDGIDSVWVNWRINSTATKHFKLPNSSGNIYLSKFNSTYSDVIVGDTIFYRIIAQDNSINHNKDSTGLISFKLTATDNNCIGNGNINMGSSSPFNTFWKGFKAQMLYTAVEILSNGGVEGNILKMAFYVLSADTLTMNNFNVKMQNTSLTILNNGFINSDWLMVYSGSYKVMSTGWQYINLQTPFYWDGVSNLLVEVCFGNNVASNASSVQGTAAVGMYYYGYREDSLACTVNPTTAWGNSAKPNVCLFIDELSGSIKNLNNIPAAYNLNQNYPNPFNPVTRIKYDIPKQSFVNLRIFDLLGREVKTLVNEVKAAGSYSIDYNATELSSGIYLYRLECNGYVDTKRMILLK